MESDSNKHANRCPNCGYDYEPWVEVCPDCNVPLATRPDLRLVRQGVGTDEDPEWTVVTNVPNAIIGKLIKSQLEDAGIPVLMLRSPSADIGYFSHNDYVPHDLRVPKRYWTEARGLIDSAASVPDFEPGYGDYDETEGDDDEEVPRDESPWRGYSAGVDWTRLQSLQRRPPPGEVPPGWSWQEPEADRGGEPQAKVEENQPPEYRSRVKRLPVEFDTSDYDLGGTTGTPRWIRIFYAILLAAISLPFLFQLLQQIASFFSAGR